mgnify:CR=1 FL=1
MNTPYLSWTTSNMDLYEYSSSYSYKKDDLVTIYTLFLYSMKSSLVYVSPGTNCKNPVIVDPFTFIVF